MGLIPWYVTLIRLIIPLSILRWPLFGIIASSISDMIDWDLIQVLNDTDDVLYQYWDKVMDLYYWLFILWILRSWKDVWAKKMAIIFFVYRVLGMILFWITGYRKLLLFFPNVFENFVVLCLLLFWNTKKSKLQLNKTQKIQMLLVLFIPKIIHEYFQHFLEVQPWEIYDVGKWLGYTDKIGHNINLLSWASILYIIPFLVFLRHMGRKYRK